MFASRHQPHRSRPARCWSIAGVASGCSSIDRLSQIGEKPKLTAIENPTAQPGYKPVQMPMPKPETASYNANSLWRNGSRAFFKDQRARADRRPPHRHRQLHRQGQHRQRDPAQPHQQGGFRRSPISPAPRRLTGNAAKVLPGKHPDHGLHRVQRRQGLGQPAGERCRPTSPPMERGYELLWRNGSRASSRISARIRSATF